MTEIDIHVHARVKGISKAGRGHNDYCANALCIVYPLAVIVGTVVPAHRKTTFFFARSVIINIITIAISNRDPPNLFIFSAHYPINCGVPCTFWTCKMRFYQ